MTYEAPELTSSHRHTKYTTTYTKIPSERDLETSLTTATQWVNEKKPTLKCIEQAEIHSRHKPHPRHSDTQLGGN